MAWLSCCYCFELVCLVPWPDAQTRPRLSAIVLPVLSGTIQERMTSARSRPCPAPLETGRFGSWRDRAVDRPSALDPDLLENLPMWQVTNGHISIRIKGLGAEKYDDGFEMNEGFIKSKVIAMIAVKQEDTNLALNLQIMTKSADLNSDDLVSYVAANENMAKAGKMLMAMNRVDEASHNHEASHNLALKARADHGGEEEYEIEEDEEMTSTSDIATDFAFFAKKYKGKLPMLLNDKKKKRTCYNCDEESHFANECPYEKRVDKPKFIKGVKPRLKPNPINDRYKRNKGRALLGPSTCPMKKRKMRRRRPEWPAWLSLSPVTLHI
ncbi:hypothetical protein QYE76_000023 [Lolium multiflorum]|uniref:CCHC-type domain-containing protein n=1 Tax=Lolium multiflorum TaxID=4521 RepID=A0AAD8UWV1_LOLMU|nr:hypothetical protein QYE76_000023 [Lolium multiflorum]